MRWDNWMRYFKFYITGCGLNTAAEEIKLTVLYGTLNFDAAIMVPDLTDATTTYDETI